MPTVSILVPSYNHGAFLADCLSSVIDQTFTDWQLILVDDRSQDVSLEVARDYSKNDSRIHVHQNESNLGTYGTLDKALSLASSKYVAILNSDDRWHRDKLDKQVNLLDAQPHLAFCYCLGDTIDKEGKALAGPNVHADWPVTSVQNLLPYLVRENRILASSVVFRREFVKFEPKMKYSGDWMALLRLGKFEAGCVPEILTYWRIHGSNTFQISKNQVAEEIKLRELILDAGLQLIKYGGDEASLKNGLVRCAMDLLALYILASDARSARRVARQWIGTQPARAAATKRFLASLLPMKKMQEKLWCQKVTDFSMFESANCGQHWQSLENLKIDWA